MEQVCSLPLLLVKRARSPDGVVVDFFYGGDGGDRLLRCCVLKHLKGWSFRDLERELRSNLIYRRFTHYDAEATPDFTTFSRLFALLGPTITEKIHARVVQVARAEGVAQGRKLRSDTTAVECELVYLFMKWNRIDLMLVRNPTDADDEGWEKQWRDDVRTIAARLDKVSGLLTGQSFDSFLSQNGELLKTVHARYRASKSAASPKDLFVKEFFHKRNRIVHFGKIDFQQPDAEMCLSLASILSQILAAMDAQRCRALEAKHSIQTQPPS